MPVAIACVPSSPTAVLSACRVTVTGAAPNDTAGYDVDEYPTSPEMRYYLTFEKSSVIHGRSYVFNVDSDGSHIFNNYIFPDDGSWTIRLNDASDDSSVATQSVTVS